MACVPFGVYTQTGIFTFQGKKEVACKFYEVLKLIKYSPLLKGTKERDMLTYYSSTLILGFLRKHSPLPKDFKDV